MVEAHIPEVFYENSNPVSEEEMVLGDPLYVQLEKKSRGIRVFYFTQSTGIDCDHLQYHDNK